MTDKELLFSGDIQPLLYKYKSLFEGLWEDSVSQGYFVRSERDDVFQKLTKRASKFRVKVLRSAFNKFSKDSKLTDEKLIPKLLFSVYQSLLLDFALWKVIENPVLLSDPFFYELFSKTLRRSLPSNFPKEDKARNGVLLLFIQEYSGLVYSSYSNFEIPLSLVVSNILRYIAEEYDTNAIITNPEISTVEPIIKKSETPPAENKIEPKKIINDETGNLDSDALINISQPDKLKIEPAPEIKNETLTTTDANTIIKKIEAASQNPEIRRYKAEWIFYMKIFHNIPLTVSQVEECWEVSEKFAQQLVMLQKDYLEKYFSSDSDYLWRELTIWYNNNFTPAVNQIDLIEKANTWNIKTAELCKVTDPNDTMFVSAIDQFLR